MMTVILRIDGKSISNLYLRTSMVDTWISYLFSADFVLGGVIAKPGIVWQTGCPKDGCEGLRVLGTWVKPGWGLGVPEIGRTGIFSPRNNYRRIRRTTA